mmetsp:Transcript_3862/g.7540  ORF Transcript_3862/g.7540 Transcript_3862/m.7540 type:complete len:154 (-) Transcript_3862:573-1034(-)
MGIEKRTVQKAFDQLTNCAISDITTAPDQNEIKCTCRRRHHHHRHRGSPWFLVPLTSASSAASSSTSSADLGPPPPPLPLPTTPSTSSSSPTPSTNSPSDPAYGLFVPPDESFDESLSAPDPSPAASPPLVATLRLSGFPTPTSARSNAQRWK